jgi:hypothetical protein
VIGRFMPSIVLVLIVLLLAVGVPPQAISVFGMLALILAVLVYVPAELHSARNERRHGGDRRHRR